MPSRTSYFNKSVFWSDQRRYWPLTAGLALLWFLLLPLSRLSQYSYSHQPPTALDICEDTLDLAASAGYWVAFIFGIFFAMAMFSYLANPRATNGLHALPARRETLYVTHYLAGLAAQVLAAALTAVVLGSHGAFDARVMGLCLLALVLPTLFFYSFGVLCMMFTGQILAAPVFYGALNILAVGVETLVRAFAGNFLFGWAEPPRMLLIPLSPIVQLVEGRLAAYIEVWKHDPAQGDFSRVEMHGLDWLLIYAAVGLVLAALGLLIYRKRHSEATGSTVAIGWARPIFKYGVTFCAALALGQLLYYLFFGQYRAQGHCSLPGVLLCMAAAGLIGYFASEMLLKKSLRVWRSGWKGALAVTAALVLLGFGMSLDLTGYEGYVPDPADVKGAYVQFSNWGADSGISGWLTDPEAVQLTAATHRAVIADKARQQSSREPFDGREMVLDGRGQGWLRLTYELKDGRIITRDYDNLVFYASELSDRNSVAGALKALYGSRAVTLMRTLEWEIPHTSMENLSFFSGSCEQGSYIGDRYESVNAELTGEQAQAVYDAVLRDVAAGRAGASLFSAPPYLLSDQAVVYPATIELRALFLGTRTEGAKAAYLTSNVRVHLTETMTETIDALRAAGFEPKF